MDTSALAHHPARTTSPSPADGAPVNNLASPLLVDDAQLVPPAAVEPPNSQADAQADTTPPVNMDTQQPPQHSISKLLKEKEREWASTAQKSPLKLLDLPVDILKEIIHQLPHTNDLTSLALCHSALHRLTIPYIYSRFDIVWPDETTHTEPRTGVDALTYGLATLVMSEDSFPHQNRQRYAAGPLKVQSSPSKAATPYPVPLRRFGNYYAQFTKKFSLGNGPAAWVQEYMIAKEGGKMLGTLVALAVAHMVNLETFVWDMPTGVLRDVWLALSSLAHRTDGEDCRLDRLWIRWHDNSQLDLPSPVPPPPLILNNVPPPPNTHHTPQPSGAVVPPVPAVIPAPSASTSNSAIDRVEYPTFSVIPPLKSLSVLDIDELPYLDEMSVLIARSQKKLRELRVGIAPHAQQREWVTPWDGEGIQQVDYNTSWPVTSSISEKRLGGVLGILVGRVHNLRHEKQRELSESNDNKGRSAEPKVTLNSTSSDGTCTVQDNETEHGFALVELPVDESGGEGASLLGGGQSQAPKPGNQSITNPSHILTDSNPATVTSPDARRPSRGPLALPSGNNVLSAEAILDGKLRLEVLELERVPLSVNVLLKAFDWTVLTTLTLLHCRNHEQLWKSLRRTFTPRNPYPSGSPASTRAYKASYTLKTDYTLNIKKIHTNTVSLSLINFLKETLAPNTLEVLFLEEGRSYSSTVTVDAIFKGPLRRHRGSLKKLMIDSSEKGVDDDATSSSRWRRWMLNREIITFITSGRMNKLRELAVSIDYRDWHYFLQRLPLIPHVRSLYIPFIADHAHGNNIDPRELALQIVDIVHLRPEVEVCYLGLSTKCFEILENRPSNYDLRHESMNAVDGHHDGLGGGYTPHDPLMSDDESEATEDEEEDDLDGGLGPAVDDEESDSEVSDGVHDESDGDDSFLQEDRKGPKFRIREILFYDNIEIFSARHGRL